MTEPKFDKMNMKTILLCLLVAGSSTLNLHAQYKTFILGATNTAHAAETNFVVGANTVVEFLGGSFDNMEQVTDIQVRVVFPDSPGGTQFTSVTNSFTGRLDFPLSFTVLERAGTTTTRAGAWPTVVIGPAMIRLSLRQGAFGSGTSTKGFYTLKIIEQGGALTPSTAVVIPSDAKGPVNIVMESSTNLVNWIGALPGTYGTSSSERYFRVRAVVQ